MAIDDTELEAIKREAERNPERAYRQAGYDAKLKQDGDRLKGLCPFHHDSNPSFKIYPNGSWYCFGCEKGGSIIDFYLKLHNISELDREVVDEMAQCLGVATNASVADNSTRSQTTVYPIRDINGSLVAEHVRIDYEDGSTDFFWRRDGTNGLDGMRLPDLPLYGTERLADANPDEAAIIVEGEKTADALCERGYLALGTVTGSSSTPSIGVLKPLAGRKVHIWPDNDDVGRRHANRIAAEIVELDIEPHMVEWAQAPEGGDAADFGGSETDLEALLNRATAWQPTGEQGLERFRNDENKLVLPRVAEHLYSQAPCFSLRGRLYRYYEGVYRPYGSESIRQDASDLLDEEYKQHYGREIEGYLGDRYAIQSADEIDSDLHILNVANGLLDMQKLDWKPHTPEYLSILQVPVEYDEQADCPEIDRFLHQVLPSDCIQLAYEIFGYILRRDLNYQIAIMLLGEGRNGKSIFIDVAQALVGETNLSNVALQDLGQDRFASAQLFGKLLNSFPDIPSSAVINSSIFKAVVGGDRISAQNKRQDRFDFRPYAVLLFSANQVPATRDHSYAYYRRWLPIQFPNTFKGDDEIPREELLSRLTASTELRGLLRRALDAACSLEARSQFIEPESVKRTSDRFRRESDTVASFADQECNADKEAFVPRQQLYEAYKQWIDQNGFRPVSQQEFNDRLNSLVSGLREYQPRLGQARPHCWKGIGLKADYRRAAEADTNWSPGEDDPFASE